MSIYDVRTYWAIISSDNPKLDKATMIFTVGDNVQGLKFSKIQLMRPRARKAERDWYENEFRRCLL